MASWNEDSDWDVLAIRDLQLRKGIRKMQRERDRLRDHIKSKLGDETLHEVITASGDVGYKFRTLKVTTSRIDAKLVRALAPERFGFEAGSRFIKECSPESTSKRLDIKLFHPKELEINEE